MHQNPQQTINRAQRILVERIQPAIEARRASLDVTVRHLPGEPEPFASATAGEFEPFAVGGAWGSAWSTSWFRLAGVVPDEWTSDGDARLVVAVDLGFDQAMGPGFQSEGLAFDRHGTIIKGVEPRNQYLPVSAVSDDDGATVDLFVEAAANPDVIGKAFKPTDLGDGPAPEGPALYRLQRAELVALLPEVGALAVDVEILIGWAEQLAATDPRRSRILTALTRCCDALDLHDVPGTTAAARAELADVLTSPAVPSAHRISAVGHAHIDSAWLWPVRETVRKCSRTFSNVLALMDDHPDLRFACSSAQQYAWIEERHPELFDRIRAAVEHGQFIPVGGMWVESDTNMPGGEALVRQFVQGKRYFVEHFGVESEEVWLPDSFGYSAALPQIAKLAGFRWFLTQKLAWNPTNRFPHHTFRWEGIDGTRLFSHMPPVDSYLAELSPRELQHTTDNFRDHGGATSSLVPFGHGDGGGGPTEIMLQRAERQRDLEGSPTIHLETPAEFFEKAEAEYLDPPVWVGELYLEAHRGTYTSQAAMKRGNRRGEHLLREAELWSTAATILHGADYPYDALERLWRTLLLHQFHDILPGSAIAWVHREAREAYEQLTAELEEIIGTALRVLAGQGDQVVRFNAAPVENTGVPSLGATAEPVSTVGGGVTVARRGDEIDIDNGVLTMVIDATGAISSLVDRERHREIVPPGARLGRLILHQDLPVAFDAWDVDEFYRASATPLDALTPIEVAQDPQGVTVTVQRRFGASSVRQRIRVESGSRVVGFDTDVDWHEAEKFLKASFPLDVHAETSASEIQFGHVRRPTHANTTWDAAKFEICAHRWVHVGEPGYGVAVVNDSTYGHDIRRLDIDSLGRSGTEIRLSLLRSPRYPDPATDQGSHRMAYRLVVGADIDDAVAEGLRLNLPVRSITGGAVPAPVVSHTGDGVVIEAVKLAEDRSGDLVVRFYESLGARTHADIVWPVDVADVRAVDLLERDDAATTADALSRTVVDVDGRRAGVDLRPFEVVTLRARPVRA